MKLSKTFVLLLVLLAISLVYTPVLARNQAVSSDRNIDIFHVSQNGPTIMIVLDYNLSSTSQLVENEIMALLVIFSQSTQEDPFSIQATMLFFHTIENKFFLFWMLGDPYTQAQNWQIGTEYEHYLTSNNQLTLTFIEFSGISNTEITVLAMFTSDIEVNAYGNDFRMTLDQFIEYLPLTYELPTIESTTTAPVTETSTTEEKTTTEDKTTTTTTEEKRTTEPSLTAGFTLISLIGISILISRTRRYH